MVAMVDRKYVLTKLGAGDWLLPSNDTRTLWRIRKGEGWELWKWKHNPALGSAPPVDPDDWNDWEFVQGYHKSRDETIKEAMRIRD